MPTRSRENLHKHTLRLRKGDAAALDAAYPSLGYNKIIRQLVSNFVDTLQTSKALPEIEIKEELLDD